MKNGSEERSSRDGEGHFFSILRLHMPLEICPPVASIFCWHERGKACYWNRSNSNLRIHVLTFLGQRLE